MNPPSNQPHAVRRVILPSGKAIEVVYFTDGASEQAALAARRVAQLQRCPQCASDLVYPIAWVQAGEDLWSLTLRCPNCERCSEGSCDRFTVQRLEEELDRATQAVVTDLKQVMHANMKAEITRFVSALDADHIWPIDF